MLRKDKFKPCLITRSYYGVLLMQDVEMACYLNLGCIELLVLCNLCNLYNVISLSFQCLANLARWEDLEQCTVENIDDTNPPDLDKVWTDTFFQVRFTEKKVSCALFFFFFFGSCEQLTFAAEQCSSLVIPHSVKHPACSDN